MAGAGWKSVAVSEQPGRIVAFPAAQGPAAHPAGRQRRPEALLTAEERRAITALVVTSMLWLALWPLRWWQPAVIYIGLLAVLWLAAWQIRRRRSHRL